MKINKVNPNMRFGAVITPFDSHVNIVKDTVRQGVSRKYVDLLLRKIREYFPGNDYFVYLNDAKYDANLNKAVRSVLVEKRNANDIDKSVWKIVRFDDRVCDYKKINWLPEYVRIVKKMSKLNFTH